MVKEIKTYEEFEKIIDCGKLVVVDFHAQWCGPCKVVAPKFAELAEEKTSIEFCKVDVDAVPKAAEHAKIKAMPTFQFYKGGKQVHEIVGANVNGVKKYIEENESA